MSIDPSAAVMRVTAGVDWAKDDHAVCVVGGQGEALERFTVRHDAAGLRQLAARLLRAGALQVGIERGDGPVVDTLLQAGLTVFVIPPGQVKNPAQPLRVGRQQGRPVRRLRSGRPGPHRCPAAAADGDRQRADRGPALGRAGPPQPGRRRQPAARPPARPCSPAPLCCSPRSTRRSPWRS